MGELRYFPRHVVEIISCVARPKKQGNVKLRRQGFLLILATDGWCVRLWIERSGFELWVRCLSPSRVGLQKDTCELLVRPDKMLGKG